MNDNKLIIYGLLLIAIACFIFAVVNKVKHIIYVYKQNRQESIKRDKANRRKISPKSKTYVLERDNYTCQICGISKQFFEDLCPGSGEYLLLEIDHIKSVARGGRGDDEDNLQVLCWKCNRKKGGNKTNEDILESIDYEIDKLRPINKHNRWF